MQLIINLMETQRKKGPWIFSSRRKIKGKNMFYSNRCDLLVSLIYNLSKGTNSSETWAFSLLKGSLAFDYS